MASLSRPLFMLKVVIGWQVFLIADRKIVKMRVRRRLLLFSSFSLFFCLVSPQFFCDFCCLNFCMTNSVTNMTLFVTNFFPFDFLLRFTIIWQIRLPFLSMIFFPDLIFSPFVRVVLWSLATCRNSSWQFF